MPIAERAIGAETYEPGQIPTGLRTRSGLMGALVCFEAMYPELVRTIVAGGVEMLANLSNDAWFGHATPAEQHLDMAALRAVETRRWLVRAATTGVSAIVDPWGRVVARIEFGRPGVISGEIRRSHAETVYQTWGDAPAWGAVGLALAASLGRRRTKHSLKGRPT
jgi:apolipoprotein N-acyltransferase